MIVDALLKANNHLRIALRVHDPAEFWKVRDLGIFCAAVRILLSSSESVILTLYHLQICSWMTQ